MATYNGEKYLREQLNSILHQSIQDYEVVISDDCSDDNTITILEEYAEKDKRFRIYVNDRNLGFKDNFQSAINRCQGEYIALCDQDDIWLPNHLEYLLSLIKNDGSLACADAVLIDEDGKETGVTLSYMDGMDFVPENSLDIARHILLAGNSFQGASMMMGSKLLKYALPFPSDTHFHDVWLATLACFTGGISYGKTPIIKYRRHSGEVTNGKKRHSAIRTFIGATLVNHSLTDRLPVVESILDRIDGLTIEQKKTLMLIRKMLIRRKNIWGRLANVPYLLRHFRIIYTTKNNTFYK